MFPVDATPLIPQKAPFVLVDELVFADDTSARSSFTIPEDHVLLEGGYLSAGGLLENIAQTSAAHAGYIARASGQPVRPGFIGAVKDFEVFALPQQGSVLTTEIRIENQIFDVTVITGKVYQDNQVLATCEMKIFIPADND
ncbi:3-hydroxyacyl-ACP dehydratase [Mucilaginibacter sp. RS28]|uniref:3-hydroxyacyl-ACP dehydratase n=1 Tax=Mucilaginibacter straminoryzae TaxID=2932774 RepID=A0A9X2BDP9_9SPHI|nr:3-hydroxyacyl-ACP dehydratase [Mucilaginibacter straminoryzae]MCJ8210558.1 3-hydroxyacyl-ACP dehydratase [Mucilaginibacter straminoryzae]